MNNEQLGIASFFAMTFFFVIGSQRSNSGYNSILDLRLR